MIPSVLPPPLTLSKTDELPSQRQERVLFGIVLCLTLMSGVGLVLLGGAKLGFWKIETMCVLTPEQISLVLTIKIFFITLFGALSLATWKKLEPLSLPAASSTTNG